jgi:hypothetical protein
MLKKPWMINKTIFEGMELRIDAAIDKVDNLERDVKLLLGENHGKDFNKILGENDLFYSVVEKVEYKYGGEAFEASQKQLQGVTRSNKVLQQKSRTRK